MWRSICSVAIWPPRMEIEFHLIVVTFLFIDFCWLKEVPRLTASFVSLERERELWIFKCVVVWSLKEAAQICYRCVSTLIMSADLLCDHWVSWECTTSVHIWVVFVKVDICVKTSDNVAERANSKRVISNIFRALTGKRLQTPAGFSNCQGNSGQGGVIMNVHLYWNSG